MSKCSPCEGRRHTLGTGSTLYTCYRLQTMIVWRKCHDIVIFPTNENEAMLGIELVIVAASGLLWHGLHVSQRTLCNSIHSDCTRSSKSLFPQDIDQLQRGEQMSKYSRYGRPVGSSAMRSRTTHPAIQSDFSRATGSPCVRPPVVVFRHHILYPNLIGFTRVNCLHSWWP